MFQEQSEFANARMITQYTHKKRVIKIIEKASNKIGVEYENAAYQELAQFFPNITNLHLHYNRKKNMPKCNRFHHLFDAFNRDLIRKARIS